MIPVREGRIYVYDHDYLDQKTVIPSEDIISVNMTERAGRRKDDGDIVLNNDDGQYDDIIANGDTLALRVAFGTSYLHPWGIASWGEGRWGYMRTIWVARVRDQNFSYEGEHQCNLELGCEDFAFSLLSDRTITAKFRNKPVNRILHEIVQRAAPIIHLYVDPSLNQRTELTLDGESVFDAMESLMDRVDAEARAWKNYVVIKDRFNRNPVFTAAPDDFRADEVLRNDEDIANYIELHGGRGIAEGKNKNEEAFYFEPIEPGDRETFQVTTEKSQLARLDLKMSTTARPAESDVTVRIQKDDNGSPTAPNDESKDIAKRTLNHNDLMKKYHGDRGQETWIEFEFPEHTLPEPNPWAIIEVDGDYAQRFTKDLQLNMTHIPYFGYDITVVEQDTDSQSVYGRREMRIEATHCSNEQEARQLAKEKLNKYSRVRHVIQGQAQTWRTHNLRPGEVVTINKPDKNLSGDYMVTERHCSFDGIHLDTNLSLQET